MRSRTHILLLLITFVQVTAGQVKLTIDPATQKITYQAVIDAPSISQKALYSASLDWFALNYAPTQVFIQANDSIQGEFKCLCNFTAPFKFNEPGVYYAMMSTTVSYNLTLQIKPGKCIITIDGLRYKYYVPGSSIANPSAKGEVVDNSFENQYLAMLTKMNDEPKRKASWMDFFQSCDSRLNNLILTYKKRIMQGKSGNDDGF